MGRKIPQAAQEAYVDGYWEEMSRFMRRIFHV